MILPKSKEIEDYLKLRKKLLNINEVEQARIKKRLLV